MRSSANGEKRRQKVSYLVVLALGVFFLVSLARNLADFSGLDDRVVVMGEEVALLEEENRVLQEEALRVTSDDFVGLAIRDNLGLVATGEAVVVLPQEYLNTQGVEVDGGGGEMEDRRANWEKWLELFL